MGIVASADADAGFEAFAELAEEPDALSLESLEQAVRATGRRTAAESATAARRAWMTFMVFSWLR
jgi:hypothetical protein